MSEPRDNDRPEAKSGVRDVTADLEARIARARQHGRAEARTGRTRQGNMSGMSLGLRLGSEFVAAIIVGAGLGYIIDMIFSTRPWGLVVLLLLGFAAGVVNVVRAARSMNAEAAAPPVGTAPGDDEDD